MLRTTEGIVSQPEFDRLFKSYAALLCDGHAGLVCEAELSYMWLPLELAWARGKLVVARSGAPEKVAAGDLLIRIDGADAVAQFHQDTALYSGSPQWKIARALENLGAGPQYSLVRLVMQRGRQFYKVELLRDWGSYPEARLIEQYAPGFFYINLKEIYAIDTLIACLPELAKAQGVIFDVRGYVKIRFSEFLPHLLPCADTVSNWIQSPQIVYPDWTEVAYQPEGWLLQPREPHIGARLVFLTDGRALSASESYLSFVRHYRLGTIIGSPTAGANGSRNWIGLLDGYILHWTGMQATLLDGAPLHCRGIMPDVSFVPSLKSLMEGRDELLEFARDFMAAEK